MSEKLSQGISTTYPVKTDYWRKPIPTNKFDWSAVEDGYEPPMPIGYGSTQAEAIADLKAQIEERKP